MRTQQNQYLADRVTKFYSEYAPSRTETYTHFKEEHIAPSTICQILNRFDETGSSIYSQNRSPKPSVNTDEMVQKVKQEFIDNPNTSLRSIAARLNISTASVQKCKRKANIETRVCPKTAKRVDTHIQRCQDGAGLLVARLDMSSTIVIIDDETYCYSDPSQIAGRKFVHIVPGNAPPTDALLHEKTKFAKKFGVWQAISSNGLKSPPVFINGTMNSEQYLEECIKKVLIPWIEKNFDINDCLFWPDLAKYHYTKQILSFLERSNLDIVSREENMPNLPECRPERYWALVKNRMKRYSAPAETLAEFATRWRREASEVEAKSGENLFTNFIEDLKTVAKDGPAANIIKRNFKKLLKPEINEKLEF